MRDYGVGAQILKDLGLMKIRLLTNNPKKTEAINFLYHGFDLEVVGQVPIVAAPTPQNAQYLAAKRDKLGHHLPLDLEACCDHEHHRQDAPASDNAARSSSIRPLPSTAGEGRGEGGRDSAHGATPRPTRRPARGERQKRKYRSGAETGGAP